MTNIQLKGYWKRYEKGRRFEIVSGYSKDVQDFFIHTIIANGYVKENTLECSKDYTVVLHFKNKNEKVTLTKRIFNEGLHTPWFVLLGDGTKELFQDYFQLNDKKAMELQRIIQEFPFEDYIE